MRYANPIDLAFADLTTAQVEQVLQISTRQRLRWCRLLKRHPIAGEQFDWSPRQAVWSPKQVKALLYLKTLLHPYPDRPGLRRSLSEVNQLLNRGLPL